MNWTTSSSYIWAVVILTTTYKACADSITLQRLREASARMRAETKAQIGKAIQSTKDTRGTMKIRVNRNDTLEVRDDSGNVLQAYRVLRTYEPGGDMCKAEYTVESMDGQAAPAEPEPPADDPA